MNAVRRLLIETGAAPFLLFNGMGTSPNDVAALEQILKHNRFEYATVDSRRLNAMRALKSLAAADRRVTTA
jgi:hypothetical protein